MVTITEVNIFSADKEDEETWALEGEILFESDLTTSFSATYLIEDDEFDEFEMEIFPGDYDKKKLKKMIVQAAKEYEE